jgi:hypothetical protein
VAHRHLAAAGPDRRGHHSFRVEIVEQQGCADDIGNRVVCSDLVEVCLVEIGAVDGRLGLTEDSALVGNSWKQRVSVFPLDQ